MSYSGEHPSFSEAICRLPVVRKVRNFVYRRLQILVNVHRNTVLFSGDVYSFAILMQQIILRSDPFQKTHLDKRSEDAMSHEEIIMDVSLRKIYFWLKYKK